MAYKDRVDVKGSVKRFTNAIIDDRDDEISIDEDRANTQGMTKLCNTVNMLVKKLDRLSVSAVASPKL